MCNRSRGSLNPRWWCGIYSYTLPFFHYFPLILLLPIPGLGLSELGQDWACVRVEGCPLEVIIVGGRGVGATGNRLFDAVALVDLLLLVGTCPLCLGANFWAVC